MKNRYFKKLKILVVCGGWSNEREVSLLSGNNIFKCLKINNYNAELFILNKSNFEKLFKKKPDLIFNALHGEFGEDGFFSNLAKKNNISFTHSDDLTSAICFDKRLLKTFLKKKLNITSPLEIDNFKDIQLPLISKPIRGGSSNGVNVISSYSSLNKFKSKKNHMLEEAIVGKELTVTVIEDQNKTIPLAVTEIEFDNLVYDYNAKYTEGESIHYLPARISKKQYKYLMNLSVKIFKACSCRSIARLDFILSAKNKKFYFLELNTHPGLTKISLAPEQANFKKMSYLNLIEKIIISSL